MTATAHPSPDDLDAFSLQGRVALVTGASSGIGMALRRFRARRRWRCGARRTASKPSSPTSLPPVTARSASR
jgi:NAD(P)-dependent dehydrogenase (short-subunit alcohol dehydrogenase family)